MVKCVYCEYENKDHENFCIKCGLPLQMSATIEGRGLADGPDVTRRLEGIKKPLDLTQWRPPRRLDAGQKVIFRLRDVDDSITLSLTEVERVILGRYNTETREKPDVDLTDYNARDKGVSRRHAAISIEGDLLKIVDLGSANSTFVNGQKLIAHQSRILQDGDEVRLGQLTLIVHFAD